MFTKRTAINRVKQFLVECRELPLAIDRAILFGSIANGKNNEDSDIDLLTYHRGLSRLVAIELLCGVPHKSSYVAKTVMCC